MSGQGQPRKDPYHINRDKVSDTLTIVRKLRLPRGAQIRARRQFGTAAIGGGTSATVTMPYAGNFNLTTTGASTGDTVLINNPFIRTTAGATLAQNIATNFIAISSRPATSTATITAVAPGQMTLTLTGAVFNGVYVISMGQRTDRRNNGFSQ